MTESCVFLPRWETACVSCTTQSKWSARLPCVAMCSQLRLWTTLTTTQVPPQPKKSFHGTGISLLQHPTCADEGVARSIALTGRDTGSKTVEPLPEYYTDVRPVASSVKGSTVPATSVTSLRRHNFEQHIEDEYMWLENTRNVLKDDVEACENTSWAAYHARHQYPKQPVITPTSLLPLFQESAHTVAMIRHSIDVVRNAVQHLNPGQTPVLTCDQPLFTLAKQLQWKWPDTYGEDKLVVMFGGMHIEMTALKTLGDWLQGSGWTQALVQAEITTAGTADSFLRAAHVTRTRRAHQFTAAALYILQRRAYDQYSTTNTEDDEHPGSFQDWCSQREQSYPQFQYWTTVLALELSTLIYVRSMREANFSMYLDALTELVPWFFALDHTNYARWIPVHLRDMAELANTHPDVFTEFSNGHFTVQKTKRMFFQQSLLTKHMSRTTRMTRVMEEPSASQTMQLH